MLRTTSVFPKRIILSAFLALCIMLLFGPAAFAEDGEVVVAETNGDYAEYSLDVADLSSEALEESDSAEEALGKRLLIVGDDGLDLTGLEGVSSIVSSGDGLYVAQFDDASAADAAFDRLSSWSSVYSVEYDASVESINSHHMSMASASSSAKHLSWGANFIGADNYISRIKSTGSRRVVIAVVDSGVDSSHSFLSSRMIRGFNFVDNNSNTSDVNGHGTHVAGIIADCTLGVNGISIMPVRALEENGYGELSAIGSSLLYACDNGADIINFSVGGPRSSYLEAVVKRIIKRDVAFVAASGNEASDIEYIGSCPAYIDEAITVGAVRRDNRVEQFSNYGRKLDFMAPGSAINSSVPNGKYAVYSGTSMAAPHVAASIALLEMEYGNLSNSKIESLLKRSCRKYPDTSLYGNGIIDLKNLAASISSQKIEISNKSYVYSGKANKPKLKVSRNGQSLFSGSDYSVSYSNNTNVGTAKVVVRGKGTYSGTKTINYTVLPKGTSIAKIAPKKKGFTLKWKKQATQTSGYEIQYSLRRDFKKAGSVYVKNNKATSKTVKKLQKNKKYFVRIRTYKTVNGKKYSSKWSSVARIVTK